MIRDTSIEVYHKIKDEGLLSKLRFEVYSTLFEHGPLTQMETCRKIRGPRQDRSYMPRFAELERMGVVRTIGERACRITQRNVLLWDVTKNLPAPLERRETSKQKIQRLTQEIAELKASMCEKCKAANKPKEPVNPNQLEMFNA